MNVGSIVQNVKAIGAGIMVGALFALARLPIPAPLALPGISGILGLWLGYMLMQLLRKDSIL
jgi:XapX domain-containing protein